ALDVIADVSRCNRMSRGKRSTTDYQLHVFSNQFFVPDAVLYRTDRAVLVEDMRSLLNSVSGMNGLGRHNAVIAAWDLPRVAGRIQFGREILRPGKPQAALANRIRVLFPDVIRPDFHFACLGQVRGKQASHRAAADDTDS